MKCLRYLMIIALIYHSQSIMAMKALEKKQLDLFFEEYIKIKDEYYAQSQSYYKIKESIDDGTNSYSQEIIESWQMILNNIRALKNKVLAIKNNTSLSEFIKKKLGNPMNYYPSILEASMEGSVNTISAAIHNAQEWIKVDQKQEEQNRKKAEEKKRKQLEEEKRSEQAAAQKKREEEAMRRRQEIEQEEEEARLRRQQEAQERKAQQKAQERKAQEEAQARKMQEEEERKRKNDPDLDPKLEKEKNARKELEEEFNAFMAKKGLEDAQIIKTLDDMKTKSYNLLNRVRTKTRFLSRLDDIKEKPYHDLFTTIETAHKAARMAVQAKELANLEKEFESLDSKMEDEAKIKAIEKLESQAQQIYEEVDYITRDVVMGSDENALKPYKEVKSKLKDAKLAIYLNQKNALDKKLTELTAGSQTAEQKIQALEDLEVNAQSIYDKVNQITKHFMGKDEKALAPYTEVKSKLKNAKLAIYLEQRNALDKKLTELTAGSQTAEEKIKALKELQKQANELNEKVNKIVTMFDEKAVEPYKDLNRDIIGALRTENLKIHEATLKSLEADLANATTEKEFDSIVQKATVLKNSVELILSIWDQKPLEPYSDFLLKAYKASIKK